MVDKSAGRFQAATRLQEPRVSKQFESERKQLRNVLLNLVVLVGILGLSAIITTWFARAMYVRCLACGTLNAKRRSKCRNCQSDLA